MKAIRILNRIVEWTTDGLWYEADQRHAEIIVKELGLESGKMRTDVPSEKLAVNDEGDVELSPQMLKQYQAFTARANYLARIGQISSTQ